MYQGGHMKKTIFALVTAVLAVFLLSSCKSREERAINYSLQGQMMGNSNRAITYFTRSLRLNPESSLTLSHRGLTHARRGEYRLAIADFDEILRLHPGHRLALIDRARTHEQFGYLELAFADLTERVQVFSVGWPSSNDHFQAHYDRARFSLRHGEYELAIEDFTAMAQLASDEPTGFQYLRAHYNRAQAHLGLGEYERAIADFTVAAHYPSRFLSAAHFWRALALMETGAFALAIADFTEALEHRPLDVRVERWGRVEYVRVAREHEFAEAHTQRGVAHLELGDLEQAIADFTEAILLNPRGATMSSDEMRRRNWGSSFQQQQLALATMRYQQLVPIRSFGTRHGRAAIDLINTPARQRARENINRSMVAAAHVAWLNNVHDQMRRNENGVTLWPPADFAAAYTLRALAYLERGDYGLAIADFENALRLAPDNFAAWEELEAALNVEPDHPFVSEILNMVMEQTTASP
jgi:tetratricopeptide (TPR) repeat protein